MHRDIAARPANRRRDTDVGLPVTLQQLAVLALNIALFGTFVFGSAWLGFLMIVISAVLIAVMAHVIDCEETKQ